MGLTPKKWESFQHYTKRAPPWIKLHRGLLDDYEFSSLPLASKALAPMLWLLASEYEGGKITMSLDAIAFRLRTPLSELVDSIKPLIERGFFVDDSNLLAACKQDACLETEGETEAEADIRAVASATRPHEKFEEFREVYPKRGGANPKEPARKAFFALMKKGTDPDEIIGGAKRYADAEAKNVGTPYIAQSVTWLNQRRWEDYPLTNVVPIRDVIHVLEGSPEMDAWDRYYRKTTGKNAMRSQKFGGFFPPTKLPPTEDVA